MDGVHIRLTRDGAVSKERLDLRREPERALVTRVVQRLLTEPVPQQEQSTAAVVPDGDREHASKPFAHLVAIFLIEMWQHFRVRPGSEAMTFGLEVTP